MEARNKMTMCRLCLFENERFFNIFEVDVWHGYVAAEVISDLFQFKVTDSDEYPHVVCETCLTKLTDFKVFKEQCQISRVTYDNVFASKEIIVDHHIQRDEFISIKTEPVDPLDKEELSKNSVNKEIEENEMDIAEEGSGSDRIIKTEVVHSFENMTGDDPMANDVLHLPSETHDIKSEIDIKETEIPAEQVIIEKIIEMEESTPLNDFHEIEIIQAEEENNVSQELSEVRRMECHHCGEKRETKLEIAQHIEDAHNSIFNEDNTPILQKRKDKKHSCSMCERRFKDKSALERHMFTHTEGNPFRCNVCNYSCYRSWSLKVHMRKHTGEKPFQCNICNYCCSHTQSLKIHMQMHTGEKPFQCNICNYRSPVSERLKVHMRIHTGEKPLQCNICNYRCNESGRLKIHMKMHTREKTFQCNICNYRCNESGRLKEHMKKHTGEKPFKCNICNYSFSHKQSLKIHMRMHTGEKPFQCNICNYSCFYKRYLKVHMRMHTGEKPFQCNICNYRCNQSGCLKRHMRIHTGEKPFQCNICNYSCSRSHALKCHMRIHTGEKPFQCNICDYRCNESGRLKKHMRIHT